MPPLPDALITLEPVEPGLTPSRIDERLEAGFFPFGQRWMTCRAWPRLEESHDTIWLRVRLAPQPPSPRWRRLIREGCTTTLGEPQLHDPEHQALYDRFRSLRHPEWVEEVAQLVLTGDRSALLDHTREIAVRDGDGRLIAFRWFLQGQRAIAGITAVYDPARSGHGTIARALADEWATAQGFEWSYPGYVFMGATRESMEYKIKRGRTEWLEPERGRWLDWERQPPPEEALVLPRIRRRLEPLGEVVHYPGWAVPYLHPPSLAIGTPYFVVMATEGADMTLMVWNHVAERYEQLHVTVRTGETEA